ncbi:MAG: undecaprenyldiphospho-muramoylpentapeptide beta-N-acetylglucosaminyltransferase [Paramuribaculum sp.]|nr:undecaprenyldiphospho-muramoylpentapeptide beta-N-acetylglucosaminyltransferase [Paramuribaculum sp.]
MHIDSPRPLRVLISGGGTGGHIFPALSIADALKRVNPKTEILFVGAQNRMEMEKVPAAGYEIVGLPVAGFDRKRLWRNAGVLVKLARSLAKAKSIVRNFRPDVAVGVGGYASGPVLKQAQKQGIPTVLQEQNSYAGVTNKMLASKAKAICTAYPGMERFFPAETIVLTGNPVRQALMECKLSKEEACEALGFDPSKPLLFVTGGSLGARTINNSVEAALKQFEDAGIQVLWQTGKLYAEHCAEVAKPYPLVKAMPFIADMATAYRAADLVVARAGAGTISELELLGKPAILIPSPNVAEDHQRKNAESLTSRGAAVMILDADAPAQLGREVCALITDNEKLKSLSDAVTALAKEGSADRIAEIIYSVVS